MERVHSALSGSVGGKGPAAPNRGHQSGHQSGPVLEEMPGQTLSPERGKECPEAFSSGEEGDGPLSGWPGAQEPRWRGRGTRSASPLASSLSRALPLPPPPIRALIWKGNSHCGSTWDLERGMTVTPRRRVSTYIIFSRTSPTCLLLNVRVMGSASDKTAYYS